MESDAHAARNYPVPAQDREKNTLPNPDRNHAFVKI